ncbi:hypothetical protein L6164_023822 [Bauhinia variegata]|uniref:Uncharacterized protein n=1 Tax=Bauhinia variegata TaxID=167791 RepID=A0ACB9MJY4_BAUVA|nr:hypothetical protein L6164_023822 [Bauhinia variegata]
MPMKTTSLAFFFLAFAFALTTALGRSIAGAGDVEPVLDTDGNPVINGGLYRILPAPPANGGGFIPLTLDGETCPISVVQASPGLGFTMFIQVASNKLVDYVYPTDSVDIIFSGRPVCTDSAKWILKFFSPVPAVFIGEEDDRTVAGHFGFEKYEDAYKLVFFPERLPGITWSLGISPFGNNRLVANEENPIKIVLQSFNRGKSASTI